MSSSKHPTDPAEFRRIKALFGMLADLAEEKRKAWIDSATDLHATTRQQLHDLFDVDAAMQGLTSRSAVHVPSLKPNIPSQWIGRQIGVYVIERELGQGGMGSVYLAHRRDGQTESTVAIKVIRPERLDERTLARFRLERRVLGALQHPHIAALLDAGELADGTPYVVMEYIDGVPITHYAQEQAMGLRRRLQLFLGVCEAVSHAHGQRVLHRDIKPSNVLVDKQGVPKLIDFGIAKLFDDANQATTTEHRFFSPQNAAPEQLQGETVGVACDVYQLGALLYELLCGRPTFDLEGKSPGAVEHAIRHELPTLPSARNTSDDLALAQARRCTDVSMLKRLLRGNLDEITLRALRKEPDRRYASVGELMQDVERHLRSLPIRARGGDRMYRASRFVVRHWRSLAVAASVVLATMAFVASRTPQSSTPRTEPERVVQEELAATATTSVEAPTIAAAQESPSSTGAVAEVTKNSGPQSNSVPSDESQPNSRLPGVFGQNADADSKALADILANLPQGSVGANDVRALNLEGLRDVERGGPDFEYAERVARATWGDQDGNTQKLRYSRAIWQIQSGHSAEGRSELENLTSEIPVSRHLGVEVRLALADISGQHQDYGRVRALLDECARGIKENAANADMSEQLAWLEKSLSTRGQSNKP